MKREELDSALGLIGWGIRNDHNGLNNCIFNHFGEPTDIFVQGDKIEIRNNIFGGDTELGRGAICFDMKDLTISHGDDGFGGSTEWVAINFSKSSFIQFYNHTEKKD